jgi:antitoxin CptB
MTTDSDTTTHPSDQVLFWASRRGMLELDLLLVPYVQAHAKQLSHSDRKLLWDLLQEEDTWLFDHLVHIKESSETPRHTVMLKRILEYADSTS